MKLHYYPETDSLYVEFKAGPGAETREVTVDSMSISTPTEMSWVLISTMPPNALISPPWRRMRCPCAHTKPADRAQPMQTFLCEFISH